MQTITRIDGSDLDYNTLLYGLVHNGLPDVEVKLGLVDESKKKKVMKEELRSVKENKEVDKPIKEESLDLTEKQRRVREVKEHRCVDRPARLEKRDRFRQEEKIEVKEDVKDVTPNVNQVDEKPKVKEEVKEVIQTQQVSLMEYVTSNQGVSLDELSKLYSKKEILQHLTQGLIFKSKGCIYS